MTIAEIINKLPEDLRPWATEVAQDWYGDEEPLDLSDEELERRMIATAKILTSPVPSDEPSSY